MSDPYATSRAIDALNDPALEAFAERIVDRVTGIVGQHQVRVEAGQDSLNAALVDIRFQLAEGNRAREANHQQIADFFRDLFAQIDVLVKRVDSLENRVTTLENRVTVVEARLDARPSPEKAQATYDGVQRILAHLGLPNGD